MRHWWFSSNHATGYVASDKNDIICNTIPIWRKFTGQPIKNLANWLRKKGGFEWEELPDA